MKQLFIIINIIVVSLLCLNCEFSPNEENTAAVITLDKESVYILINDTEVVTVNARKKDGTIDTITTAISTDETIATVTIDGMSLLITGISLGTTSISIITSSNIAASISVNVIPEISDNDNSNDNNNINENCRTVAKTYHNSELNETFNCNFSTTELKYSCIANNPEYYHIYEYNTIEDFIYEGKIIGLQLFTKETYTNLSSQLRVITYTYNDSNQITTIVKTTSNLDGSNPIDTLWQYTLWDKQNRPIVGISADEENFTIHYDSLSNIRQLIYHDSGMDIVEYFDEHKIKFKKVITSDDVISTTDYTISETMTICNE